MKAHVEDEERNRTMFCSPKFSDVIKNQISENLIILNLSKAHRFLGQQTNRVAVPSHLIAAGQE